jgi:hypothetical protein
LIVNHSGEPPSLDLNLLSNFLDYWVIIEQGLFWKTKPEFRYYTLMKVFLLDEDFFLDEEVSAKLEKILLRIVMTPAVSEDNKNVGETFDFEKWIGPKFSTFFTDFVERFAAVSYGDRVFTVVLALFLTMRSSSVSILFVFSSELSITTSRFTDE